MSEQILYIHDSSGKLVSVQIPAQLWQRIMPFAARFFTANGQEPQETKVGQAGHDLKAFNEFMQAWNFRYPYKPEVCCPHCQASTANWQQGSDFTLLNANIGGLMVFRCNNCKSTVRQKFFKDHVACEFTAP